MVFGATVLIFIANKFKGKHFKVFIYGAVLGSVVEYALSFILEAIYGIRFWDYSYLKFNLNGRICTVYSIFWGFLCLILIQVVVPLINKFINKIPFKKCVDVCLFIFLLLDCFATIWAITAYEKRALGENNNRPIFIHNIENKLFSDEFMVRTFPNLRIITDDGEEVFIRDI